MGIVTAVTGVVRVGSVLPDPPTVLQIRIDSIEGGAMSVVEGKQEIRM